MNISKNYIPSEDKTFYPRDPPWLTKNCKDFYKNYHRKYKRFVRRGCIPTEKTQIDELRNEYSKLVQTEKDKYLKKLGSEVSNPQTSQKKYWSALKKLLNKNISTVIPPILYENVFITDIKEKCILFNNYFKNQCRILNTTSVLPPFEKTTNLSINRINVDPDKILEYIRKLNVNKSHPTELQPKC